MPGRGRHDGLLASVGVQGDDAAGGEIAHSGHEDPAVPVDRDAGRLQRRIGVKSREDAVR